MFILISGPKPFLTQVSLAGVVYLGCKSMPFNVAKVGNKLCKVAFFFSSVSLLRLNMHILSIHLSVVKDKQTGSEGVTISPFPQ